MNFKDKNIVITGSSAGIGKACAELFMKNGANVIIHGASLKGKAIAEELDDKYTGKAIFIQADLRNMKDVEYLYEESVKNYANVDVLVNCAGVVPQGTVLDIETDEFDEVFALNVKSIFFLSKMFVEHMISNGKGNIVNIASIAGLIGPKNRALYSASKGAIISLTRAMAADFAQTGVRINCICPGMVYSPSLKERIDSTEDPEKTRKIFEDNIPIKRIGTPEEIAHMVCSISCDENSFMTGSVITIDGGASL